MTSLSSFWFSLGFFARVFACCKLAPHYGRVIVRKCEHVELLVEESA